MSASLSTIARRLDFVRETEGPNKGYWVSMFLRFTGNEEGQSWCASFVAFCDSIATKGKMRVKKTASTVEMLNFAKGLHEVVTTPAIDDLVFSVNEEGIPHHVGVVSSIDPLKSIAGNTSEDGTSSNGDRVAEHEISPTNKVFVRLSA